MNHRVAAFLARPEIQAYLEALKQLRALRAEITHEHRLGQAADLLLDIARKTEDLVEKRRAADTLVRLLLGPSTRRTRSDARSESRAHRKPTARPSSSPHTPSPAAHPQPTNPPPVPLPASFLALLHPDDPLRKQHAPIAHPTTQPTIVPTPPAPPHPAAHSTSHPTIVSPPGLTLTTSPHHPASAGSLTLAAGAPQSHNTS